MIKDLFSHKIHSSHDEWPDKLADIAAIFNEFDGQLFDRDIIEKRFQKISPRASYLNSRDPSKFRDEISAYPAYLGLYYLKASPTGWIVNITETTKRFLVNEEPDIASFLRLQLPLFQYPNAMGTVHKSYTNKIRIQSNTSQRTLEFINQGIHLSPLRTICVALKADAHLKHGSILDASVSHREIFELANSSLINQKALPLFDEVVQLLDSIRTGQFRPHMNFENRFHILKHTEIFSSENGFIKIRKGVNEADNNQLIKQLNTIASIGNEFTFFDKCSDEKRLKESIKTGAWGEYFDGVMSLPSHVVETLTTDKAVDIAILTQPYVKKDTSINLSPVAEIYPFRVRNRDLPIPKPYDRKKELADPEVTKIKRQRRNLAHKELIDLMDSWLIKIGAQPKENEHIDLFAEIPGDGSFIFEMKSGGESLLEQIRKGLSQLYEYRYRYRNKLQYEEISLCLVLPENPTSIPWITDYLCSDRKINICWFDETGSPFWPEICDENMNVLRENICKNSG